MYFEGSNLTSKFEPNQIPFVAVHVQRKRMSTAQKHEAALNNLLSKQQTPSPTAPELFW